jgi:uncharacterized protein YjiS (DUF1127 family)
MTYLRRVAARILATVGRIAFWPARVAAARAVFAQLCAMDARELADIGLTPHDLRDATAAPLDADPSALFAVRAAEAKACVCDRRRVIRAEPPREWAREIRSRAI